MGKQAISLIGQEGAGNIVSFETLEPRVLLSGTVESVASLPFTEGFEDGSLEALGAYWTVESQYTDKVCVTSDWNPRGEYHLEIQPTPSSYPHFPSYARAVTIHLDLLDGQNPIEGATLDFWGKVDGSSDNPYAYNYARLVTFMRDSDESMWRQVYDPYNPFSYWGMQTNEYTKQSIDLDFHIERYDLNHSDDFQVAFGFYSYPYSFDESICGYIDDVSVTINSRISGSIWHDLDGNSLKDDSEPAVDGWTMYLDQNNNGLLDQGETSAKTDNRGNYTFVLPQGGTYTVACLLEENSVCTTPSIIPQTVTLDLGQRETIADIGIRRLAPDIDVEIGYEGNVHSLDFGIVSVGKSYSRTLTLRNESSSDLHVSEALGLENPFSIDIENGAGTEDDWLIHPYETVKLTVTYNPSTRGTASDTLILLSDDPDEASYEIALTGECIAPRMSVEFRGQEVTNGQTKPIDFGTTAVATKGRTFTFSITNTGESDLDILSFETPDGFSLQWLYHISAPAGSTRQFTVTLHSSVVGEYSGDLVIHTNVPEAPEFRFMISGEVREPENGELQCIQTLTDNDGAIHGLTEVRETLFSPDGRYLYTISRTDRVLSVYEIDESKQPQFVQHAGYGLAAGMYPTAIATSPDGEYVYVSSSHCINYLSCNKLFVFERNPETGLLSEYGIYDSGLYSTGTVNVSPDGDNIYVGGRGLTVFSKDANTDSLVATQTITEGIDGITTINKITTSPDGRSLYAASSSGTIITFDRNPNTGELTFVDTIHGTDEGIEGLGNAKGITVSPDGSQVIVASSGGTIAVFSRNASTGSLTYERFFQTDVGGVTDWSCANDVTVSPDGTHVYSSREEDDSIAVFQRDPSNGDIAFSHSLGKGSDILKLLDGPSSIAISADGTTVAISAQDSNSIILMERNVDSGELSATGFAKEDWGGVNGLDGVTTLATSPDGMYVYAYAYRDSSLTVFRRNDATGSLELHQILRKGYFGVEGLGGILLVSPCGQHVYAIGGYTIAVFSKDTLTGELSFQGLCQHGNYWKQSYSRVVGASTSPNGEYVYIEIADSSDNYTTAMFSRDQNTGMLTSPLPLQRLHSEGTGSVYCTERSQDGLHLYCLDMANNKLSLFKQDSITANPTLVEVYSILNKHGQGIGYSTCNMILSEDGKNLYVTSAAQGMVFVFSRDVQSGQLSLLQKIGDEKHLDYLENIQGFSLNQSGNRVYVFSNTFMSVFSRNAENGSLDYMQTICHSQWMTAKGSYGASIVPSPDGEFVYATHSNNNSVFVLKASTISQAPNIVVEFHGMDMENSQPLPEVLYNDLVHRTLPIADFTIRNEGNHPLVLSGINLSPGLVILQPLPTELAPGEAADLRIQLAPGIAGEYTGSVEILSNDPDEPVYAFPVLTAGPRTQTDGELTFLGSNTVKSHQSQYQSYYVQIHVSPNGRLASVGWNGLRILRSDPATMEWSLVDCIEDIGAPNTMSFSRDGRHLYVADFKGGEPLRVFKIDPVSGKLSHLQTLHPLDFLDASRSQDKVIGLEVSQDGRRLFVLGSYNGLTVFQRDPETGFITFESFFDMDHVNYREFKQLALSANGDHLHILDHEGRIRTFHVSNPDSSITFVGRSQPIEDSYALSFCHDFVVSPDERHAYAVSGGRMYQWERDSETGIFEYKRELSIEWYRYGGMDGYSSVDMSIDGRHVYVRSSSHDGSLGVLKRNPVTGDLEVIEILKNQEDGVEDIERTAASFISNDGEYYYSLNSCGDLTTFRRYVDPTEIVDRHVFYNGSCLDGKDHSANSGDDKAIAVGKEALLPGQTAGLANYTGYAQGINGVMIDIKNLANPARLTADDFAFGVGTDNNYDDWIDAESPLSVTVRQGAGVGGSDRVTITWADNVIKNQWLRVVCKATSNTGLSQNDTFYFGNMAGDLTGDGEVNAMDLLQLRQNYLATSKPGQMNQDDITGDGVVNAFDMLVIRKNYLQKLDMIQGEIPEPLPVQVEEVVIEDGNIQRSNVQTFEVTFSEDVDVTADSMTITGQTNGEVDMSETWFHYDSETHTATWSLPESLPDDRYVAEIEVSDINFELSSSQGVPENHVFEFHRLAGDSNGDAIVDSIDLLRVRQDYLKSSFLEEDLADLNGDGVVDLLDMLTVRQNYLRELA